MDGWCVEYPDGDADAVDDGQAGMRQPFSFFAARFSEHLAGNGFLGLGRWRMLRTVEVARKMFRIFN